MYWLRALSLFGRGGLWLYCLGGIVRLREEFGTPSGLEILHGGVGGDVEQGARTSKHIVVFAFAPLVSLTLSLFYLCKASFIAFILYTLPVLPCIYFILQFILICLAYLCVCIIHIVWIACLCASLILIQQELHIAPQPISRGIKRS